MINDNCFTYACALFGFLPGDYESQAHTVRRECISTAMLINCSYQCQRPANANAAYDLVIGNALGSTPNRYIDLKTEYVGKYLLSEDENNDIDILSESSEGQLEYSITTAISKEERDNIICLFDISYLFESHKSFAKEIIANRAMVLNYDLIGETIRLCDFGTYLKIKKS
ncbi:hypothetical protein IB274_07335 [Pseudomonas sp. PDM18]|nr:hypothetical protein [Pseudomonas sp. PDM18]